MLADHDLGKAEPPHDAVEHQRAGPDHIDPSRMHRGDRRSFRPGLGDPLFQTPAATLTIDEPPSAGQAHHGSAFQSGWWGYVDKDLRAVLGDPVAGPFPRTFCGGGNLAACRQVLLDSLRQATAVPATTVYPAGGPCSAGDQWCADSIVQSPLGGITDPPIAWQNRPTYQQVVSFPASRPS